MARVRVSVPDDLLGRARLAGVRLSDLVTVALEDELRRREKLQAMDEFLASLADDLGPVPAEEAAAARHWAETAGVPTRSEP